MGEILEYDELLDITLKIQEMTISNDNEKTSKKDGNSGKKKKQIDSKMIKDMG